MIALRVDYPPRAKGTPRFRARVREGGGLGGKKYIDSKTVLAEEAIVTAWEKAGRPAIDTRDPLAVWIVAELDRPDAHRLRNGSLSAAGQRKPIPTKWPNLDGVADLVMDALTGRAFARDTLAVGLIVVKRWADLGTKPGLRIVVTNLSEHQVELLVNLVPPVPA